MPGLGFIKKLRPVTYNLDIEGLNKVLRNTEGNNTEANEQLSPEEAKEKSENLKFKHTGFVAQEVEKAATDLNYDFGGIDKPKNDKDMYGLRYSEFVVPLVKAVQELSAQNDELKQNNTSLQQQIDELKTMVQSLAKGTAINTVNSTTLSGATLEQNTPNPFNQSTAIRYTLPASRSFGTAQIVITDQTGKVLKQMNIATAGKGMLNVQADSLAAGSYSYSLVVDGHMIDTKKMVLIQ